MGFNKNNLKTNFTSIPTEFDSFLLKLGVMFKFSSIHMVSTDGKSINRGDVPGTYGGYPQLGLRF